MSMREWLPCAVVLALAAGLGTAIAAESQRFGQPIAAEDAAAWDISSRRTVSDCRREAARQRKVPSSTRRNAWPAMARKGKVSPTIGWSAVS